MKNTIVPGFEPGRITISHHGVRPCAVDLCAIPPLITNLGSSYLYSTHIFGVFSYIDLDQYFVLCPTISVAMFRRERIFHSLHTCTVIALRQLTGIIKKLTIRISFKSLI